MDQKLLPTPPPEPERPDCTPLVYTPPFSSSSGPAYPSAPACPATPLCTSLGPQPAHPTASTPLRHAQPPPALQPPGGLPTSATPRLLPLQPLAHGAAWADDESEEPSPEPLQLLQPRAGGGSEARGGGSGLAARPWEQPARRDGGGPGAQPGKQPAAGAGGAVAGVGPVCDAVDPSWTAMKDVMDYMMTGGPQDLVAHALE